MNGTDTPSVAYCRACGKALTEEQQKRSQGTVYCEEHVPQEAPSGTEGGAASAAASASASPASPGASPNDSGASPWTVPPTPGAASAKYTASSASPGLAFLLGLIPGVGAIYNGQYAKGLLHVVIMGMMASIASAGDTGLEWMIGMLLIVFPFYMAFEAYHTAMRREKGLPVDEFSSILPLRTNSKAAFPAGPVVLIVAGVLFLLHNLDILRISHLIRFWPVLLIVLGVYMIYVRVSSPASGEEGRHEQ